MVLSNLSATGVTSDSITVTWDISDKFVPSNIIMTVSNDGSHSSVGINPTSSTGTASNLLPKTTYTVSLKALADNYWFDSNSIFVTTD